MRAKHGVIKLCLEPQWLALDAHSGAVELHLLAIDTHPGAIESYPGAFRAQYETEMSFWSHVAHPRAVKAHFGTLEAHP